MNRHTLSRAFTLIEILIVVVILGILAGVVLTQYWKAADDAKREVTLSELKKIRRHLEVYSVQHAGARPPVLGGIGTWGPLVGREYMTSAPVNAWIGGGEAGRTVLIGTAADTSFHQTYGWIYDPATGNVWAAGFDANDQAIAP